MLSIETCHLWVPRIVFPWIVSFRVFYLPASAMLFGNMQERLPSALFFVFVSAGLIIRGLRKLMLHVSLRVLSKSMSIPSIVFMFIRNGFKYRHYMRSIRIILHNGSGKRNFTGNSKWRDKRNCTVPANPGHRRSKWQSQCEHGGKLYEERKLTRSFTSFDVNWIQLLGCE